MTATEGEEEMATIASLITKMSIAKESIKAKEEATMKDQAEETEAEAVEGTTKGMTRLKKRNSLKQMRNQILQLSKSSKRKARPHSLMTSISCWD